MIASLGMYDPHWLQGANDALWAGIARHLRAGGIAAPAHLSRDRPLDAIWTAPDLLLAQTCGYPLTMHLGDAVQPVATLSYTAPGCEGARHRSALVVRGDDPAQGLADLRGRRAALNTRDSNTGMNLLRAAIGPLSEGKPFFGAVIETGAHARSVMAVAGGKADIAAIDAVTLALLHDRYPGLARRIRVLGWTAPSPGLPLITAPGGPVEALRAALAAVLADPALAAARRALRIAGVHVLARADYAVIPAMAHEAAAAGYPDLA